jgi:hypothetical protein
MGERFTVASTGTQLGMTLLQQRVVGRMLAKLLQRHRDRLYVVHGDCVGSDAMCDALCAAYQIRRGIYPSDVESKRAHRERNGAEVLRPPSPPLERNGRIVSSSDLLIATPKSHEEELRSGTWATVRCARKLYQERSGPQATMFDEKKAGSIVIVWPNGAADFDYPERRPAMIVT